MKQRLAFIFIIQTYNMPKHTQVITIEITPERFLENCSDDELKEIDLLIQSERYQSRIREKEIGFKQINKKDENTNKH